MKLLFKPPCTLPSNIIGRKYKKQESYIDIYKKKDIKNRLQF